MSWIEKIQSVKIKSTSNASLISMTGHITGEAGGGGWVVSLDMKIKVVQHVERERMRKSVSVPGSQLLSDVQTIWNLTLASKQMYYWIKPAA